MSARKGVELWLWPAFALGVGESLDNPHNGSNLRLASFAGGFFRSNITSVLQTLDFCICIPSNTCYFPIVWRSRACSLKKGGKAAKWMVGSA